MLFVPKPGFENVEDLVELYSRSSDYIIIGGGNNIILSKEYYEREFIIFNGNMDSIKLLNNNVLEVEAGATTRQLALFALSNGLTGVEFLTDIPSSMGVRL